MDTPQVITFEIQLLFVPEKSTMLVIIMTALKTDEISPKINPYLMPVGRAEIVAL